MYIIRRIICFFKNKILKRSNIKMIDKAEKNKKTEGKEEFINSIKLNKTKKNEVETLICYGDGLGIKHKIDVQ